MELVKKIVNVFLRFNVKNKVIKIDAGQPLLQLIPFKRMNWTLSIEKPNEKLKKMSHIVFPVHLYGAETLYYRVL